MDESSEPVPRGHGFDAAHAEELGSALTRSTAAEIGPAFSLGPTVAGITETGKAIASASLFRSAALENGLGFSLGPTVAGITKVGEAIASVAAEARMLEGRGHSIPYLPNPVHESNRRLAGLQVLLENQARLATAREAAVAKREADATRRERRNARLMVASILISAIGVAATVIALFR